MKTYVGLTKAGLDFVQNLVQVDSETFIEDEEGNEIHELMRWNCPTELFGIKDDSVIAYFQEIPQIDKLDHVFTCVDLILYDLRTENEKHIYTFFQWTYNPTLDPPGFRRDTGAVWIPEPSRRVKLIGTLP